MKDIVIVGAGGFGREVKFLLENINKIKNKYTILGFYDDDSELNSNINGLPLLGSIEDLVTSERKVCVVLGIGVPQIKKKLIDRLSKNKLLDFPAIIDPKAIIGNDNVQIGDGTVICAGAILTCNIAVKKFVTINLCTTIGHDTIIDNFSSFMPSVNISGEVLIKSSVYVGTGAKIINQLEIGENAIIGAGAVVSKSLPANCTAVGIPAKPIKFNV